MHIGSFVRGKGMFMHRPSTCHRRAHHRRFPLLLTTGRILSQYNVGAQTRRTANVAWHHEDVLEIHPQDAEDRGINDGDQVTLASRDGETTLPAKISERMPPGVVYTTFHSRYRRQRGHHRVTDWATDCPEYKVTAVQVWRGTRSASEWQERYEETRKLTTVVAGRKAPVDSGTR